MKPTPRESASVPSARRRWAAWVGIIVASFLAATVLAQWRMRAIDEPALVIADYAAPSIEHLAAARSDLLRVQLLIPDALGPARLDALERIRRSHQQVEHQINDYLILPVFPDEHALWSEILRDKDAFGHVAARFEVETERGDSPDVRALATELSAAAEDLGEAISRGIEFHAQRTHTLALDIRRVRARSTYFAFALDAVAVLVAIFGVAQLRRATRLHGALVERHQRLLEERANEMELFAGRVAHDILGPLGTVRLALELAKSPAAEADRERLLARGASALGRVNQLVSGLLRFAQAGAKPEPGASTEVQHALSDLVSELRASAAEAGAELTADYEGTLHVACNVGVLGSLIANLAGNAIRYIGHGAERRIWIRVKDAGDRVRFEVEDTGPGLSPGTDEQVFEPYIRGRDAAGPGIGLGLATVKRLAEAHGGRVGVRSIPGRGSTFWFELPKADASNRQPAVVRRERVAG